MMPVVDEVMLRKALFCVHRARDVLGEASNEQKIEDLATLLMDEAVPCVRCNVYYFDEVERSKHRHLDIKTRFQRILIRSAKNLF